MKALIASDLHYEFHRDGGRTLTQHLGDADILICAGDLSNAAGIWDALLLLLAKYKHVIFVPGNHEFYGSNIGAVRQKLAKLLARLAKSEDNLGQLHVLDNGVVEIEGRRFVGSTLWVRWQPGIELKHGALNDFNMIGRAWERLYEENRLAIAFLEETVQEGDIVITHHLPSQKSVHPKYEGSPINCFFVCDIEELIKQRNPKVWIHGHTHESCDYVVNTTQVICNPFGYAGLEENVLFNPAFIIDI